MNITIKESMLLRKCLNNYVLDNSLEYDKSPLFNDLIYKLKEFENKAFDPFKEQKEQTRKTLNWELKKYSFQTITNKKILELDKLESINNNNRYIKNRLSYEEWLKVAKTNKRNK